MKATLYRICFGIIKGRIMLKQHYTPLLLNTRSIMKSTLRWKIAQEMTHTLQTYNSVRDTIGNALQCLAMPGNAFCCFVVCICCKIMYRSERPETAACRECMRQSLAGD